ncbi:MULTISPECIES: Dps family protein [unclassified Variovorax]|uniref:Dps family protein n=1 Tax=unclassified Variovorax TaxID=663243 RepID=UPI00076DF19E|nr:MULTISPECIES: Dps family protein [unclassified Variovorax]KWT97863.1 Non-specific DNA-binding protein Dps [Variovorax sp. WDL1]PNG59300.1 DNA protection during starvation protein 1 [Variovorax sp. B4]PNG60909.1 DNA protection during starvation protein 1 [Variovorax sp. B2]VTV13164.1 DNA protection during starvation protein 1 [Variovorax sp. WDL1]
MAKLDKKSKSAVANAPATFAGKVPKKGGSLVAQESGGRNAPIINIGIDREDRAAIAEGLSRVLADTYTLYLTTHNFHWNVTGPHFNSLHAMFMAQYTELWGSTDVIAERIRALGHYAPGSYAEFSKIATVPDVPRDPPKAMDMVRILVKGHETVSRIAREFIPVAEEAGDDPTADMLTARCTVHDQTAWMLRSLLED